MAFGGGRRSGFRALVCLLLGIWGCGDSGNPSTGNAPRGDSGTPVDGAVGSNLGDVAAPSDASAVVEGGGAVPDGSMPADAGPVVCAGKPTQSCAACTSCDRCPGCSTNPAQGACVGTPKSCSACAGMCPGCSGCNPGLTCTGDNSALTCAECNSAVSCLSGHCEGCTLDDAGACTGTLSACSTLSAYDDISCAAQVNCMVADVACTGTAFPCSSNDATTCAQELGCSWKTDAGAAAACTGSIKPCAEIPVSDCAAIAGCALVPANGAASCDPTTSACFACGGSPDAGPSSVCAPPSACCGASASMQTCQAKAACATAAFTTSCDGAEDCPGASCCVALQLATTGTVGVAAKGMASCGTSCPLNESSGNYYFENSVACHSGADCTNVVDDQFGVPLGNCCVATGYAVGECVSDTFASIFQMGGGACN